MAKDQVSWVSLDDVLAAADRGLAPLGPELAGFVVLEATARARELGGVVDLGRLAIGTSGHVALTSQPGRGDEIAATTALRTALAELLAVATSTTPALRVCAKRRAGMSLAVLARELEGALIPLNRAASRRGIARVARATLEAIAAGKLPEEPVKARREISEPPVQAPVRAAPPAPRPPPAMVHVEAETPTPLHVPVDDATPYAASVFEPIGAPPIALAAASAVQTMAAESIPGLDDEDDSDIEIVSNLPPLVAEGAPEKGAPEKGVQRAGPDPVATLIDSFEVSRRRDDRALARDLKAMVGIETAVPPAVMVSVRLREPKVVVAEDIASGHENGHEPLVDEPATHTPLPPRAKRRGSFLAFLGFAVLAGGVAMGAVRPSTLDAVFGAPAAPPGEAPAAATGDHGPAASAPIKAPVTCEATLTLEGVQPGAEVLRRLGATPISVAVPARVPMDLVATLEGAAPQRVHLDANAAWQSDAAGLRLDVPFTLEPLTPETLTLENKATSSQAKWPVATNASPLRGGEVARGLLRATSTPPGATLWATVDPSAIAVPCGAAVDLLVVAGGARKPVRVEWTAFTGAPPRATTKL